MNLNPQDSVSFIERFISFSKVEFKKLAKSGQLIGRIKSRYTDDYYADSLDDGSTEWLPVDLTDDSEYTLGDVVDGKLLIGSKKLMDKNVRISVTSDEPNIIGMAFHTFMYLEFKSKKDDNFYVLPDVSGSESLSPEEIYTLSVTYGVTSTYRPKFLRGVQNLDSIYDKLINLKYLTKSKSITKLGDSYLKSLSQDLKDSTNTFAKSIGSYHTVR